ncbi:MAG: hypothetical protein ACRCS9_10355 [Hyphomicrobium sp.]
MTAVAAPGPEILIVDDEIMILTLLTNFLELLGCTRVHRAVDLKRGMKLVNDVGIALDGAIVDLRIGADYSYPIIDVLRTRHVPVAFMTGFGANAIDAGYEDIQRLPKPVALRDVERFVESVKASRSAKA